MNKRWLAVLLVLPLVGGLVLREVKSWRPERIAVLISRQLQLRTSPDGKWLLARDGTLRIGTVPDTSQLIELNTLKRRLVEDKQEPFDNSPHQISVWHCSRWTDRSRLVADDPLDAWGSDSNVTLFDPKTLKPDTVFTPPHAEKVLAWTESKDDLWMLTSHLWLHFDAHNGELLKQRAFRANDCYPEFRIGRASLSPDGQKAVVEVYDRSGETLQFRQLWDLQSNKPMRRVAKSLPTQWLSNDFYVDENGCQRHITDSSILRTFSKDGKGSYCLDQANHIAIIGVKSVKWYDLATLKLIDETRLPTMKFDSLDFSPDHSIGYFSVGNEIWRQRLK